MSMRALLLATRDHLRSETPKGTLPTATVDTGLGGQKGLNDDIIQVMPSGRPLATACDTFVSIWPASWNVTGTSYESLDEEYSVMITVSTRLTKKPPECWFELLTDADGLLAWCEAIRATLHLNYDVSRRANAIIDAAVVDATNNSGTQVAGFEEPLYFSNASAPRIEAGNWYYANSKERYAALVIDLTFRPARRTQHPELQF